MSLEIDRLATSVATRRGTLALGSAAALLGLSQMGSASAKKGKNKKSCKKQVQEQVAEACGPQVDQCGAYFSSACGQFSDPQKCFSVIKTCCAPLAECSFTEMIQCMTTTPME
jgi:hypothetical protein